MKNNGYRKYPPSEECWWINANQPANCSDVKYCLNTDSPPLFCREIWVKKPVLIFCRPFTHHQKWIVSSVLVSVLASGTVYRRFEPLSDQTLMCGRS